MKRRVVLKANIIVVVAMLLSACATPTAEVVEKEVTEVVEVEKVAASLRVSVAQFPDALPQSEEFLEQAMLGAAEELGIELEFEVRTLAGAAVDPCPVTTAAILGYDLYLLDSPSALYAFEEHDLDPVPTDILRSAAPFELGIRAFTDPNGQVLGLAQATAPLMTIYNPEEIGELPEQLSPEETKELVEEYGVAIPNHSCIGVAAVHSAVGEEFTEDLIFQGGYLDLAPEYAPIVDELSQLNVFAADSDEIVEAFINQQVLFVIHNSGFLAKLAEAGYDGPLATTRFPRLNHQGGSAQSVGWVVSAGSGNAELAWALAEKLTRDPAMLQWGLANGMVPMNQAGLDMLTEDPSLADGLLPRRLFDDFGQGGLWNSAAEAVCWRVPTYVPIDLYNAIFLPAGGKVIATVATDRIPLTAAAELLEEERLKLELDSQVYFDHGITYYEEGLFEHAIVDFDQAILLDSQYAEAYHGRGVAYAELGKREEAISDLEMALELGLDPSLEQETEKLLEELKQ